MHNLNIGIVADWLVTYAGSEKVIKEFLNEVYPKYKNNKRVDILLNNTDFGVGENKE